MSPNCTLTQQNVAIIIFSANRFTEKQCEVLNEVLGKIQILGKTVTNQNCIHKEIKRKLNSRNVCCHSVQNLLSSHLLSKNLQIKMHKALTLREEEGLRVFENRLLT
jgi:hypothetical protein